MKGLSSTSAWSADEVEAFLSSYRAPLRVAFQAQNGFPLICSLWFSYEGGRILCASNEKSRVVACAHTNPKCAIELAPNEPPYFGVRGRGNVSVLRQGGGELLGRLIDRYLEDRDSDLARWLLGRAEQEVCLSIELEWLTSWDYRDRMER